MLVLLHGQEPYLVRQRARELKEEAVAQGEAVWDIDCAQEDVSQAFSQLNTPSLFEPAKIFFFHNPFGLREWEDKEVQRLMLATPNTLVFVCGEAKKTDPLARFLFSHAKAEEFGKLKIADLKAWCAQECARRHVELSPKAQELLLFSCGSDLERLCQETAKLAAFKLFSQHKTIQAKDVLSLVAQRIEPRIFSTIEAMAAKNRRTATKLLAEHLAKREEPLGLLAMFAWQVRTLLCIRDLQERGIGEKEIAARMKLHPFVAQKGVAGAQRFSFAELKELYRRIFSLDLALKTGKRNPEQLLYLFVGQAATKENQRS